MTTLTTAGFTKSTRAERVAELEGIWQSAFGATIDVGPDSPDGQIIDSVAGMFADFDDIAEAIYNGLLPGGGAGDFLARLVLLNGLWKNRGARSTCPVSIGGTAGTVIPTSAIVRCTTETDQTVTWSPIAPVTVGDDETAAGVLICSKPGDYAAPAGSLTRIQTVIAGWTSVTNATDATKGYADEVDERLRARRARSTALPSQGMTDGTLAGLLNLDDVISAVVWENEGDAPKVMAGGTLPPHSIYAVVDGGDPAEIAEVIRVRRPGGCTMVGDETETVLDGQGRPVEIKFSRPTDVPLWIELDVTQRAGWVSGTDAAIAQAIVDASEEPGAVAIGGDSNNEFAWSDVLAWIAQAGLTGFSVTEVRIGASEGPTTPWQNVAIDFDAIARFDLTRILVTVS